MQVVLELGVGLHERLVKPADLLRARLRRVVLLLRYLLLTEQARHHVPHVLVVGKRHRVQAHSVADLEEVEVEVEEAVVRKEVVEKGLSWWRRWRWW